MREEAALLGRERYPAAHAVSLRLRLIGLIALIFAGSLALGGTLACLNASRSVQAEMRSALAVARQMIEAGIAGLARSDDPERDLQQLVLSFRGNRHVRVALTSGDRVVVAPVEERSPLAQVPPWFVLLIGVPPTRLSLAVSVAGHSDGAITIETVPHNEILEIWNEFGDSLLLLALFSGPTVLLIFIFVGQALRPLDRLAAALGRVAEGDYSVRLAGRLPPELARLRDSFNRMAGQLAAMAAENRRLNEQLLTLQEQERSDLARDLHDEIGPSLFAIGIDAANISRHLAENRVAPIAGEAEAIAETVGYLQRQVRSMLGRLRPIGLAEFGLIEAIGNLAAFWRRRHPEIDYRLAIAPEAAGFGDLVDTAIYRVVQECLSNAVRHSRPSTIAITIDLQAAAGGDGEMLVVRVADDGQGMTASAGIGYGLIGMGERVKAMGGSLTVSSKPSEGLTVVATLPPPQGQPLASAAALP